MIGGAVQDLESCAAFHFMTCVILGNCVSIRERQQCRAFKGRNKSYFDVFAASGCFKMGKFYASGKAGQAEKSR